jgi:hypothetical protein
MTTGTSAYRSQLLAQPDAVAKALAETDPPRLDPERALVFTGVGSSLHACHVAAHWVTAITEGRVRPAVVDALELTISGGVRSATALNRLRAAGHPDARHLAGGVLAWVDEVDPSLPRY